MSAEHGEDTSYAAIRSLREGICRVVHGKRRVVDLTLMAVVARGHVLLQDVPGVTFGVVQGRQYFCDRSGDLDVARRATDPLHQQARRLQHAVADHPTRQTEPTTTRPQPVVRIARDAVRRRRAGLAVRSARDHAPQQVLHVPTRVDEVERQPIDFVTLHPVVGRQSKHESCY